jgi:hypothetical protein
MLDVSEALCHASCVLRLRTPYRTNQKTRSHDFSVTLNSYMKRALRNVTVTLDQEVALWARVEAARNDTSVSQLLGSILKQRMTESEDYERAMRRSLSRKPFLKTDGRYLSRDEVHDRSRIR